MNTSDTRSRLMSRVRQKNTRPELIIRRSLHAAGFRFRLHDRKLAGTPDIVLPKYNTAIFVHGCFWHFHENCQYSKIPSTNTDFWKTKRHQNVTRDQMKARLLIEAGWRVLIVWECATKGDKEELLNSIANFLKDSETSLAILEIRRTAG